MMMIGGEVILQAVIETDGANFDFALPDVGRYVIEVSASLSIVETETKDLCMTIWDSRNIWDLVLFWETFG